ncbi:uncharacterized protein LOC113305522 [Papaver somniferum]|uniref:uncharacterized protein LOC113305522 n=1 Tax=Papaver somniferum TaxID=3469 RepID=UPI000E6F9E29|nr:uncharacterized protein LOC113305522 [Papaver somniferum]
MVPDMKYQNSRENLLKKESRNTKYFHSRANYRRRRNHIDSLKDDMGPWHSNRQEIEQLLNIHFSSITTSSNPQRDEEILSLISPFINEEDNARLKKYQTWRKSKNIVFQIKPWVAPGPDGFQAGFYQLCWNIVVSVLLNGSSCQPFTPTKGLRQGDPISPYLFILCMEGFSRMLCKAESTKKIQGIKPRKYNPSINHLLFVDDCLLFCKGKDQEIRNLLNIINKFSAASEQVYNFNKSSVFFKKHMQPQRAHHITNLLQMKTMGLNEKYLGLPLFLGKNKRESFKPIEEKVQSRLSTWQGKIIDQAGRSTQVQSVLGTMANYQMGFFKMPKHVIEFIDRIQKRYWWRADNKKGMSPISWDSVCKPKRLGGMGFKNTVKFNDAILAKMDWRMITAENSLCARILKDKYFHNKEPLCDEITTQGSWIWKSIYKGLQIDKKYYVWSIGDGAKIKIWKHNWIANITHTHLTNASQHYGDNDTVQILIKKEPKQWDIQSINQKSSHTESRKIQEIRIPTNARDTINWILTINDTFTVKFTYKDLIQEVNGDNISSEAQKLWLKICIIMSIRNFCTKHNILGGENNHTSRHHARITKKKWEKPPQNWLKLNFDATFDKHSKTCGIGLILRDCAGKFLEAMVKVTTSRYAEQGEGLALLEAVE